jgi:hypothetical protein
MSYLRSMLPALVLACSTACGDGVIQFGPDTDAGGGNNITVSGNISSVIVDNALRDIVVFVYTDLSSSVQLPQDLPGLTSSDFTAVRTQVVGSGAARSFSLDNVRRGALTVIFLQDRATDPDGQVDESDVTSDSVAVFDGESRLDPVRAGQSVNLADVEIDFPAAAAIADRIVITAADETASGN